MKKNMRFEMRVSEEMLDHLQEVKKYYEEQYKEKFSLAKTIEYTIEFEYLWITEGK